uniref:Uncharacterized protein n=1 Tax=Candidatus Kentrum sp. LPFa TaxID=2126335 RepID=A0A450WCG4_9GAMM|nr:MAG: hypothetical protein BECKLPF1236B_GA0070989_106613 [Candidatus Kentron sp. LPFa]
MRAAIHHKNPSPTDTPYKSIPPRNKTQNKKRAVRLFESNGPGCWNKYPYIGANKLILRYDNPKTIRLSSTPRRRSARSTPRRSSARCTPFPEYPFQLTSCNVHRFDASKRGKPHIIGKRGLFSGNGRKRYTDYYRQHSGFSGIVFHGLSPRLILDWPETCH